MCSAFVVLRVCMCAASVRISYFLREEPINYCSIISSRCCSTASLLA
jgi:hypothetical protein